MLFNIQQEVCIAPTQLTLNMLTIFQVFPNDYLLMFMEFSLWVVRGELSLSDLLRSLQ